MSTKDRNEKLAAARKKLKKFQSRNASKTPSSQPLDHPLLTAPAPLSNILLTEDPEPVQLTSLTLTTPTDTPITVTNGYTGSGWSLPKRPLTPTDPLPSTDLGTLHSHSGYTLDGGLTSLHTDSHTRTAETHKYHQTTQDDGRAVGQLEQHVQAHAQTIDILVSEKTALQSQLSSLHTNLRNKTREVEDLAAHLQSTRQQLEENERIKLSLAEDKAHFERTLSQMSGFRDELESSLQKMRLALEDTRQENTELISKVTSQAAELHSLQEANVELQSKLNMAELLTQQLSAESLSPSSPSNTLSGLTDQLDQLHGEVKRLEGVVRSVSGERDQALSDLDALRDAMIQQQQDSAQRLSELHSKLVESEAERLSLSEQLQSMRQREDELTQHASTEHAQLQQSAQVAMETLQQEKFELQTQLQLQVEENQRLAQLLEQMELHVAEAEREGARLREAAVDSGSLLDTMSRDKEALSRAVGQNKELKTQLVELQDAFVKMSKQNMELATELETERFRLAQLQAQRHREEEETETRTEVATQTEEEEEREEVEGKWTVGGGEVGDGGEVMEVLPESSHLTELLQRMEGERSMLHQQLQTLSEERDGLHQEVSRLQSQISTAADHNDSLQSPSPNDRSSPHDETGGSVTADVTQDLLSSLQANFNALQERYVAVMADKAELMEIVEHKEVTIGQLSGETETIGEYIMLYQRQREALREKFKEKDNFIQHLISEKASIESQLGEVQRLMKQLLSERGDHRVTSLPPRSATPPSSPSLPLHLRPLTYHHPHHHTPSPSPSPPPLPPSSSDTVGQIIQLLTVMGEGGEGVKDAKVPCPCCTGDIITV